MLYLLDSNTYIEAKNQFYPFDFCPAYWDWLDRLFERDIACSIQMVGEELREGNDELAEWAKARRMHFLSEDDPATQSAMEAIANYVEKGPFTQGSRHKFLTRADPWVIAKAQALQATVVTREKFDPENSRKVKIPNICKVFSVPCIDTFDFLRMTKVRFVLL